MTFEDLEEMRPQLWTWAHRTLGDAACAQIQSACARLRDETPVHFGSRDCICGPTLSILAVLTVLS